MQHFFFKERKYGRYQYTLIFPFIKCTMIVIEVCNFSECAVTLIESFGIYSKILMEI